MAISIGWNSKIVAEAVSEPVMRAAAILKRDIQAVFKSDSFERNDILLVKEAQEKECYCIVVNENRIEIHAADDLGFVYGIYHVSSTFLGIHDFWFWNDQEFIKKEFVEVPDEYMYQASPFPVKLRGWFVNDEVLLHTWTVEDDKDKPWEMVFETLLRLGGNMVVPGTDKNASYYRKLAAGMGLKITHHHAEPLGAEMFSRAYPDLNPSYEEHADKFQQLWIEGIEDQKDIQVVWSLGFRGQGDCPFWENDPRYQTDIERGKLISELIEIQYNLVKRQIPDAVCCTNLYGETMELYQRGYLTIPEDIIKIWADNGYGKMVTRRQENHNPRIPALPDEEEGGRHGIYYHVSFYDLQAANHITLLPNSSTFVKQELEKVLHSGVRDYWIINCSNVKPHIYYLDFIAEMWRTGEVDIAKHLNNYVKDYYGEEKSGDISNCLMDYFKCAPAFGSHEDEHAGEQFSNYNVRILASSFMKNRNKPAEELMWLTPKESFEEQVKYLGAIYIKAEEQYKGYLESCLETASVLSLAVRTLFRDSILLQAQLHYYCYSGARFITRSLEMALAGDYKSAFYFAGRGKKDYILADKMMRRREHGKWRGFYENECLTDIKLTARVLCGYMSFVRNLGEGPYFYEWQRELLYSEEDKRVVLITNMENHLSDDEIYELMKDGREESWQQSQV